MPANATAAAVTDVYRADLADLRGATGRRLAQGLLAVDLDLPPEDLDGILFDVWADDAAVLVTAAQREAARLSAGYLPAYLTASGVDPTWNGPADVDAIAGRHNGAPITAAVLAAPRALLWMLARSGNVTAARESAAARASRLANDAVAAAAREVLAEGMESEPSVTTWQRVTSANPCPSCLAFAGETAPSANVGLASHESCACSAEPVLDGVRDTVRRPTGQEMFDALDPAEQDELFLGSGGAAKAALVRVHGVAALARTDATGRLVEVPLADLADL